MKNGPSVSVVGLGYVGLSTAACFADAGVRVIGVDVDEKKLRRLERGDLPFREEGLDKMLRSSVRRGTFRVSADHGEAVRESSITFLTVGTPSLPDGRIDLSYVLAAAGGVAKALAAKKGRHNVVVKSTVVPGTTEGPVLETLERLSGKRCGSGFGLASNPEFLREGQAVRDTLHPDAIVLGPVDPGSKRALLSLYRAFYRKLPPVVSTTPANAELIKYAVNSFRATQLSFLNTFANLCHGVPGADIDQVAAGLSRLTGADPRYLKAGLGFGGSCFPKDLRAVIAYARGAGASPDLLESTLRVNEGQPSVAIEMAKGMTGEMAGKLVAVLGLAFKAGTDDVRESVAIRLVERLLDQGAKVRVYDPAAMENARRLLGERVDYATSARGCISGADCAFVATEWPEFARIRPVEVRRLMRDAAIVDGRRLLASGALGKEGVKVRAMGTGSPSRSSG